MYKSNGMKLRDSMKVMRFHSTVAKQQKETVGQHITGVMSLAFDLYRTARGMDPPGRLMVYILLHDSGEVWTGDIPHPFKRKNELLAGELEARELEYRWEYGWEVMNQLTDEQYAVFKYLDLLDCQLCFIDEYRAGNMDLASIIGGIGGLWPKLEKRAAMLPPDLCNIAEPQLRQLKEKYNYVR